MTQKGFANIVVVIIAVLVLAAVGGYFAFKQDFFAGSTDKVSKPVIDLKVSPLAVEKNGTFLLTWSTQNAVSCEASSPTASDLPFKMNWSGPVELSGSRTYNGTPHDLLFELTCKNSAGEATFASVSVAVKSEEVPNETSNWKTYRNEKYGFEIKYPQDWDFNEVQQVGVPYGFNIHPRTNDFDGRYSLLSILPGFCQRVLNTIPKKKTVNGIVMERYDYGRTITPVFHFVGNANNGWDPKCNTIQIDSETNPDLYGKFEQILSTFKFIK